MSDGEQAPLGHEAQLVKANRWVQIGHTLLDQENVTWPDQLILGACAPSLLSPPPERLPRSSTATALSARPPPLRSGTPALVDRPT